MRDAAEVAAAASGVHVDNAVLVRWTSKRGARGENYAAVVEQLRKGPIDLATQLQQLPETGNLGFYNLNLGWPIELTERLNLHRKQLLIAAENKHYSDQEALNTLLELMLLAPRRKGRHGVDQLNERWLGLDRNNPLAWPVGTPVLINRNNNEKGLSNGDLGLIRSDERGRKVAVIASGDGAKRIP